MATPITDRTVSATIAVVYLASGPLLLPREAWLRSIGLGAVVMLAATAIAAFIGRRPLAWIEPLAVTMIAALLLWFPTFPAFGGPGSRVSLFGALGAQVVTLLWLAQRWVNPGRTPMHLRTSLQSSLGFGALAALGLSAIATIPILVLLLSGDPKGLTILWVYPAYFCGTLSAALIYWLLQGISHMAVGRYLIGMLGGLCIYAAVGPIAFALDHDPFDVRQILTLAYIAGSIVGPAVALTIDTAAS